jgi:hypothetical protein
MKQKTFIEEMVKPDYNDWKEKMIMQNVFMDIIEKIQHRQDLNFLESR